jgi:hypothetical protein
MLIFLYSETVDGVFEYALGTKLLKRSLGQLAKPLVGV